MCGIVGQARSDGSAVDRGLIEAMCAGLEHRGPDSRGVHVDEAVGLGIQRLRVIDLETGDQPVYNEDRSVAVVLNGEIYNYRGLRRRLQANGHRFASDGDTEVIAHLYEEEGPDFVRSLSGMFAIALWDARRRELFVARDRIGKKPLFYAARAGALSFASELWALLADPEVPREVDPVALDRFLTYTYVPAPYSAFRGVRKLPPGSLLRWRNGAFDIERYWRPGFGPKLEVGSEAEAGELVRDAVREAVRRRLVADVPLGAFLSGGVDSTAVLAAMAELSSTPVKTFSIGFESAGFNELPYAREIAELFGAEHHELVVRPDAVELLPKLTRHYGEPFADHSAIPSFYLAEMTRRHVTVALTGDGGDEVFGGYGRYAHGAMLERLDRVPAGMRRSAARLAARLRPDGDLNSPRNRLRRAAALLPLSPADRYLRAMSRFGLDLRESLYTPEFRAALAEPAATTIAEPWEASSAANPIDRMLDVDQQTYLPGDLLVKMDIATMAYGLEARSPLLDHEVVELGAALPIRFKVRGREKKIALRAALRGVVPDHHIDRAKQGFQVPMAEWFRTDLRELARETLLGETAASRGYLRRDVVAGLLQRHLDREEDNSSLLWSALALELWQQQVVEARPQGERAHALA
ncbi:MAG TPA: asparagine synthase (glutamine-hydrolyzing) [Solirubrobacterales bacterium]|nr:asparagine synthase (glutamine-hydrolyzing) [Solirubrobacterales bacterium]